MSNLIKFLEDTGTIDAFNTAVDKLAAKSNISHGGREMILNEMRQYRVIANSRANTRAGACQVGKKIIQLHIRLYDKGREEQRNSTLLHEVGHALAHAVYGRVQSHGREWKTTMMLLGASTKRTCDFDFLAEAQKKTAKLVYACQRCEHEWLTQRKKKYPAHAYRHPGCGGVLYLKENKRTGMRMPNPSKQAA